jgi:hypothetical protein
MDLFELEQASSQHPGIDPLPDYDSGAINPAKSEPAMMFSSRSISSLMRMDNETLWDNHGTLPLGSDTPSESHPDQVDRVFKLVVDPDDTDLHGFSRDQSDTQLVDIMGINTTASLSPRISAPSKGRSAIRQSSSRHSRRSRFSVVVDDDHGPGVIEKRDNKNRCKERNRVAAAQCRAKAKKLGNYLEETHRIQTALNTKLKQTEEYLRNELSFWRTQALQHAFCGCRSIQEYNLQKARHLSAGSGCYASLSSASCNLVNDRSSSNTILGGS